MHISHRFAAVQLLQYWLVHFVAQPPVTVVALQVDAIRLDRGEGAYSISFSDDVR